MIRVLLAKTAVFLHTELIRRIFLTLCSVVVPLLALRACEDDVLTNARLSHIATSIFPFANLILADKKNDLWANKQCIVSWNTDISKPSTYITNFARETNRIHQLTMPAK